ncbi:UDP-glycosyltransferase 92A1-like protein [Cinnamomum micranthum f. kanehirae]|uniref:UDP-glycosyltransferase 92A1-like protein n=1 Tax=Cinnamomum micranthum f. kanehirae TaxID=337451 RepID=A0A443PE22_9MAGN|nr:UDP-glycosyltransferase 92A1-like protein [Cinnamomum micranthum f. kanehirae]
MAHFILFPLMAHGHFIPFVALARLLEQRTGHTITIVNTPLNIPTLQSMLPPQSTIRLASLPFNVLLICIISDFFFGWTVEIAHMHGIFHLVFVTGAAHSSAIGFTNWIRLPHTKTDSEYLT